jgi:hypothetical protein
VVTAGTPPFSQFRGPAPCWPTYVLQSGNRADDWEKCIRDQEQRIAAAEPVLGVAREIGQAITANEGRVQFESVSLLAVARTACGFRLKNPPVGFTGFHGQPLLVQAP